MSRTSRPLSLISLTLLICSFFAAALPASVHAQEIITVNTTRDLPGAACGTFSTAARPLYTSQCSLRQALNRAISAGGNATIVFNIPSADDYETLPGFDITTSTWTITLGFIDSSIPIDAEPLTPINVPNVFIDGDSQATFGGVSETGPRVYIDGTHEDTQGGIVVSNTSNVTIGRLGIINFSGNATPGDLDGVGIELFSVTNGRIIGCSIGVAPNGTTPAPNDAAGVLVQAGANNTIGGNNSTNDEFNVISGNTNDGILIRQGATNTIVTGNRIGVNRIGNQAIPNGQNGIQIEQFATNTRIGSLENQPISDGTLRNTIAGNGGYGIFIDRTNNNAIYGNWIGSDNFFNQRIPNQSGGILIFATTSQTSSGNRIGGTTTQARNIISGNNGPGIRIQGTLSNENVIANNWIGVGFSTTTVVSNTDGIVMTDGGDGNIIGGNGVPALDNYISGNTGVGISLSGNGPGETNPLEAQDNIISGNKIGIRPGGLPMPQPLLFGNGDSGVFVGSNTRRTIIGGDSVEKRNTISNNGGDGITIVGSRIEEPKVGSSIVERNQFSGIYILGANKASVTGLDGNPNQIISNVLTGVEVVSSTLTLINLNKIDKNGAGGVLVQTNSLTTTVNTNTLDQNVGTGIQFSASTDITALDNLVKASTLNGIQVSNSKLGTFDSNTIERSGQSGMLIETGSRNISIYNATVYTSTLAGLTINGSSMITPTFGLYQGNTGGGVQMAGSVSHINISDATVQLNGSHGLSVAAIAPTTGISVTSNIFSKNTGSGIRVTGDIPTVGQHYNMLIRSNIVISNTVDGIHLGDGGAGPHPQRVWMRGNVITGNGIPAGTPFPVPAGLLGKGIVLEPDTVGVPGSATNPNHDIEPPYLLTLNQDGRITGKVYADGTPGACMPADKCLVRLFIPNPVSRDGQGEEPLSIIPTIDASGNFTATLSAVPRQYTATATDAMSNTSRFAIFTPQPGLTLSPGQSLTGKPGDVITITHTLLNSGNVGFTKLQASTLPSLSRWLTTPIPNTPFALAPGETKLITYTVKLPTGADEQVRVGTTGTISLTVTSNSAGADGITVSVADQITIQPSVVLDLSAGLAGSGIPGTTMVYPHTVTNNGNITTTVQLSALTTVDGLPAPTWTTSITPTTFTLAPGASASTVVRVFVSTNASAGPPPTVAQTTITATPFVNGTPDNTQIKSVVDTTTASIDQKALLFPDREGDAGAGETIRFSHTIQNKSNGTATFKISAVSSQGSRISFTSDTPGVSIINGNTVTISNQPGADTFTFFANIIVDRRPLAGQKDIITIVLLDANGGVIGGASVQDTITITRAVIFPRLYLPLVDKP